MLALTRKPACLSQAIVVHESQFNLSKNTCSSGLRK
jgi:hypothetical protein